jgi:hypothetical protein
MLISDLTVRMQGNLDFYWSQGKAGMHKSQAAGDRSDWILYDGNCYYFYVLFT